MSNIYFFSGPCGCEKTTLAKAYAKHLVNKRNDHSSIYLIHGDTRKHRITKRGDVDMLERALFLKDKLDHLPENQGHLLDNTGKTIEQELQLLDMNMKQFISK